ncbi:preprotein translocase subunit SecY [Mesomycoplasma neurolyticum]|uniref:Protein translocase subunit SecY n=1 Tax=Mesomycoplasma neurolyticum TaxID=2120 RepID=A0A449A662_9BACT|nr:preprotein translocase subunit SecY [Mesomycoplasma neurolyticum]VEU59745.1 preprotein translocase subunit SecY [Mesomycoplasma neurolyticum]
MFKQIFKLLALIWFVITKLYIKTKAKIEIFLREKILTKKIIFTLWLLSIFVISTTITLPGIKLKQNSLDPNSFLGVIDIVGGGGLSNFSIMALGIGPFITASLIMMIAQTKLFPPVHRLSNSGPLGRKKINIITRILTIFIAIIQSIVLIKTVVDRQENNFIIIEDNSIGFKYVALPLVLIGGSLFALFLGEQITEKGVGNGTSLLIFSGIASRLQSTFRHAFNYFLGNGKDAATISNTIVFILYIVAFLVLIFIIARFHLAERKIPIQQTGAGMTRNVKDISYLPIKINPAGIMPVIFALILLSLPTLFSNLLDPYTSPTRNWIEKNLRITNPIGFSIFIVLVFLLSIGMGLQQSRVDKIAEDFSKNSTFIPGVRPGEQTEDYLISVVLRLSFFSAIFLIVLASLQPILHFIGIPISVTFSGTSLIILVTTALETISQIKARRQSEMISKKRKQMAKQINSKHNKHSNKKKDTFLLW